jgi:Major Facilitator Superfamily
MALLSIVSILTIRADAIDYDRARGLHDGPSKSREKPSGLSLLISNRGLLIFCLCFVIFHLANAAMLPLVGQKLALQDKNQGTALISGCIVAAQLVMVPMAMLVGHKADIWGRKPLFLAGFAILSLRGFLYPLSDDRLWLFAVQSLDGVGAGLYGALFPLIVADLTHGHWSFHFGPGRCDHGTRHRRGGQHIIGRTRRRSCGLFRRLSRFGWHSGFRISALFLWYARNARR